MKSILYKLSAVLFVTCLLFFTSCKKDDNNDDFNFGSSEMSMTVDGKPWKATMALMMTVPPEENDEDYYVVALVGSEVNVDEGDDIKDNQGLTIYFAVPKAKFKSAGGTYNFTGIEEVNPTNPAFAWFSSAVNSENSFYSTRSGGGSSGSLTVTKFKTGKQSYLGISIGEYEGYTHLAGTFSMTLTEHVTAEDATPRVIQITNGKFDVNSGLSFGGLFGQYSEMKSKILSK